MKFTFDILDTNEETVINKYMIMERIARTMDSQKIELALILGTSHESREQHAKRY